jgi:hypothetical protein
MIDNNDSIVSDFLAVEFASTGEALLVDINDSEEPIERTPLDSQEKAELARCEKIIKDSKEAFLAIGNALREIKAKKLFREKYKTFSEYCKNVWGFGRVNANRYIKAFETSEILETEPSSSTFKITNVSQARAIPSDSTADQVKKIAAKAKELSGGKEPSGKNVRDAVAIVCPVKENQPQSEASTFNEGFSQVSEIPVAGLFDLYEVLFKANVALVNSSSFADAVRQLDKAKRMVNEWLSPYMIEREAA